MCASTTADGTIPSFLTLSRLFHTCHVIDTGSTPEHPVLKLILESILDIYIGKEGKAQKNWVGTQATYTAIETWKRQSDFRESELWVLPESTVGLMTHLDLSVSSHRDSFLLLFSFSPCSPANPLLCATVIFYLQLLRG